MARQLRTDRPNRRPGRLGCDCNPATAGGLLCIIHGLTGLPRSLTDPNICGDSYLNVARPGLPDPRAPLPQSNPFKESPSGRWPWPRRTSSAMAGGSRLAASLLTPPHPRHDPPHVNTHRRLFSDPMTSCHRDRSRTERHSACICRALRPDKRQEQPRLDHRRAIDNSHNGVKPVLDERSRRSERAIRNVVRSPFLLARRSDRRHSLWRRPCVGAHQHLLPRRTSPWAARSKPSTSRSSGTTCISRQRHCPFPRPRVGCLYIPDHNRHLCPGRSRRHPPDLHARPRRPLCDHSRTVPSWGHSAVS